MAAVASAAPAASRPGGWEAHPPGFVGWGRAPHNPPQQDPDVVQEGRAIDFVFHLASSGFLEGGGGGLEGGEVRGERAGTEASVPVVVRLDPRLRRRDGVEMPAQIEIRTLDLAERPYRHTACFSSR